MIDGAGALGLRTLLMRRLSTHLRSTTHRGALAGIFLMVLVIAAGASQQVPADAPALTSDAAKALKSPIPYATASISRGRFVYASLGCNACHGNDGKALIEIVANATDLTNPSVWKNGTDEGLIFRSIRDGAGLSMPAFKTQVEDQQDVWHLVNFIRSLWPEAQRPQKVAGH